MKIVFISILMTVLSVNLVNAQAQDETSSLVGTWEIDLRPSPDAEAYLKNFEITKISKSSFKGTFYGSKIEEGLINMRFDEPYLAFKTKDRSSTYYHFVKIVNNSVEGLTYSEDRSLIQPWNGQKKQ